LTVAVSACPRLYLPEGFMLNVFLKPPPEMGGSRKT
jgi:hypothetical protein